MTADQRSGATDAELLDQAVEQVRTCEEKRCTMCKRVKPVDEFAIRPARGNGRPGRTSRCKACLNLARKMSYQAERVKHERRAPRELPTEKRCGRCNVTRPAEHFTRNHNQRDGLSSTCKDCKRRYDLAHRYGLTMDQFDALLDAQGGRCAVCGCALVWEMGGRQVNVDHDHACCPTPAKSCGRCVTGILCGPCNLGLGSFGDDPDRLLAAAAYVLQRRDVLVPAGGAQ